MKLKKFDQLGDAFDVSNLAMLRDAIKDDHNGDVKAFLEGYVSEVMYAHGHTAQELMYVTQLIKYFDVEAQHYAWNLVTNLIDKRGINNENDLYS